MDNLLLHKCQLVLTYNQYLINMNLIKRIENLWRLSGLELDEKKGQSSKSKSVIEVLQADIFNKKSHMATIIDMSPDVDLDS